eukprot:jgi/Galph1/3841/GphlegSOOS_G2456.1
MEVQIQAYTNSILNEEQNHKDGTERQQNRKEDMDDEIANLEANLSSRQKSKGFIPTKLYPYMLGAFASMAGMLLGVDLSTISGANLFYPEDLHLNENQFSLVSAGAALGAIPGAIILGPANELVGRRFTIVIACAVFTAGAILEAAANSYGVLIAGRLLVGMGIGLTGTAPIYVSECIRKEVRGNVTVLFELNVIFGELLGTVVAAIFVRVSGNWRWMLGSSILWSTIVMIAVPFLVESPRWLMKKGRKLESFAAWRKIRGFDDMASKVEFFEMEKAVLAERELAKVRPWYYLDLFLVPRNRRAFVAALVVTMLSQLDGNLSIIYYLGVLFEELGFSKITSVYMSLIGTGCYFLGTIPGAFLLDSWGRRTLAIGPAYIVFIGNIFLGFSFLASNFKIFEGLYIAGLIIYELSQGTYQTIIWLTNAEVYPTYLRGFGMSVGDCTIFFWVFIVTYNFTKMRRAMTNTGLFVGFYGGITLIGATLMLLYLPEVKGRSLEEVDKIFSLSSKEIMKRNWYSTKESMKCILKGKWKEALTRDFSDVYKNPESTRAV